MSTPTVALLIGSPRYPSRTVTLAEEIAASLSRKLPARMDFIAIKDSWRHLCQATARHELNPQGESLLRRIETADAVVLASPVYMGSYSGMLKHVLDLLDQYALRGKPALLCATGGSDRYGLVVEHQFMPLAGFFRCQVVPTPIYATEAHFRDYALSDPDLRLRIDRAAEEMARLLHCKP
ncbi:FMN reductase [plant metagenome]|uniref:FMN reductase n=1 Tax=plant metagenome TaxID=1297885 RepID=A0A484R4Z9_9ZZZZ